MNEQKQIIVASAFIHRDGKLFIAKRADTKRFLPGLWEIPGGKIEFGETMEQGLAREVKEEIGVEIVIGEPFAAFTYIANGTVHAVEVDYLATLAPNQEIQLKPEDHSDYRWISAQEVDELWDYNDQLRRQLSQQGNHQSLPDHDPVRDIVKKGFARLAEKAQLTVEVNHA